MKARSTTTGTVLASLASALIWLTSLAGCGSGATAMSMPPPSEQEPAAFALTLATDKLPVLQGATATLEVTVARGPGFTGAVELTALGLPAGATLAPLSIAAGETRGTLVVAAAADAPHSLPTAVTVRAAGGASAVTKPVTVTVTGAPGALDTSFAGGGKVIVPMSPGDDYAYALAVQPDGKLLVAGRAADHQGDLAVARLERDGAVDPTFGAAGKVSTDVAGGSDTAYAVAVQPDGKIVVAGSATVAGGGLDFVVARYLPDGSLDGTFGDAASPGRVTTAFGADSDVAYAVVVQPDGKIVVGGETSQGSSTTGVDFALARFEANGRLDATFGDPATPGKIVTPVAIGGARDTIYALALEPMAGGDTRIVAAGGEGDFMLARYTATGQLDAGFGAGGKVTGLFGSAIGAARAVAVAADGSLIVAGHSQHDFALVRLDPTGRVDPTFGAGGKVVTPLSTTNWDEAQALALDADGKIVLAGWAYEGGSSSGNFALARYGADGALDPSWGGTGSVVTPVAASGKADQATAVLLQIDDRIPAVRVVAAGSANGSNNDFAVTRYWR